MDPTRRIDTRPVAAARAKAQAHGARSADAGEAVDANTGAGSEPGTVAALSEGLEPAVVAAAAEARRKSDAHIESLRREVQEGRYHVDAKVVARRIVDDAVGEE